jgi:hypothetical protein
VFRSKYKLRFATILLMILLTIACGMANADPIANPIANQSIGCGKANAGSVTEFSGECALRFRIERVLRHSPAAGLTGFDSVFTSVHWIDPRPRTTPVRFFLGINQGRAPAPGATEFERDLYFVVDAFQHLVFGKQREIMSIYSGCRKNRDADTCPQYNGKGK